MANKILKRNKHMLALFIIFSFAFFHLHSNAANAAGEISISPAIIDESGYARDILNLGIVITNNTTRKLQLHANVKNIERDSGVQEFENLYGAERAQSLANWIEVQRSVIELNPGEKKQIPLTIKVSNHAVPGKYHAVVGFGIGSTVEAAERKGFAGEVMVNYEVKKDIKEFMQIKFFRPERVFFSGLPVNFEYELENTGNQELAPKGEIIIYDRRGREVQAIDINTDENKISKGEAIAFRDVWEKDGVGNNLLATVSSSIGSFGRYKALLRVEYGGQQKSLQDTAFFWVIPIHLIAGLFIAMASFVVFVVRRVHKRSYN